MPLTPEERLARLEAEVFDRARSRRPRASRADSLADLSLTGAKDGDRLVYDKTRGMVVPQTESAHTHPHILAEHQDVLAPILGNNDVLVFDESAGDWLPRRLGGSACRVYGLSSPSPTSPSPDVDNVMHWASLDTNQFDDEVFSFTPGGQSVSLLKPGRYLVTSQLGWGEFGGLPDGNNDQQVLEHLCGVRVMRQKFNGEVILESSRPASGPGRYTTNEGTATINNLAGFSFARVELSYSWRRRGASLTPSVSALGTLWPSMSVVYLGA